SFPRRLTPAASRSAWRTGAPAACRRPFPQEPGGRPARPRPAICWDRIGRPPRRMGVNGSSMGGISGREGDTMKRHALCVAALGMFLMPALPLQGETAEATPKLYVTNSDG